MAREASITQEQVNAAADAIRASGAKPTARGIRDQLGTGSMATVLKLFQVWQSGQVKPAAQDVTLPPALTRALVDFIGQEVATARAGLEADLATAQQSQADLIAESERQGGQIEAQAEALELANGEKAELMGKLGQMESDLATAREEAARERQAAETARTELAKAQLRLEAMPRLEADLADVRAQLQDVDQRRQQAERDLAVCKSERLSIEQAKAEAIKGLEARLADAQGQHRQAVTEVKEARDALIRATEQLTTAQAARAEEGQKAAERIGKLEGTVAALEKQIAAVKGKPETKAKAGEKKAGGE